MFYQIFRAQKTGKLSAGGVDRSSYELGSSRLQNMNLSKTSWESVFSCVDIGCETKPPILEWDKTADFENGKKSPILIMRQNRRF